MSRPWLPVARIRRYESDPVGIGVFDRTHPGLMSNQQNVRRAAITRPQFAHYGHAVAPLWTYPAFGRLWTGLAISRLGDQFTAIALLWFVLQLTGSGAAVGLVIVCFDLPALVTGPFLGMLLDRYQPRTVMAVDNAARAGIIAAIPVLYWLGVLQFWHIVILALAAGALQPATFVGVRSYLPHLVPDQELNRANTLLVGNLQFASLIGPAAAGALVAIIGGPAILLIDAASFVIMALVAIGLPKVERERASTSSRQERSWLGFGPLLRKPDVRAMTLLSVVFFFAYGPIVPALPVYSETVLHAGAAGYGLLWSGYGIGAVLGLLLVGRVSRLSKPGVTLALIAILWGAFLLPLIGVTSLPVAMLFLALGGAAWVPYAVIETTLLQRLVPAKIRGEVFGARSTLTTAAPPLGSAFGGLLLACLSAPAVIGISAAGCIAAGLVGLFSPALVHLSAVPEARLDADSG